MLLSWITSDIFLNTIGIIAILVLCLLLLVKELLRTADRPWSRAWMRSLNFAIFPLLLIFGLVVVGRLISLLEFV